HTTLTLLSYHLTLTFSLFYPTIRHPPSSTLFPYTTLFRSHGFPTRVVPSARPGIFPIATSRCWSSSSSPASASASRSIPTMAKRSEEHTSELQSRGHLVCRLLLEKKKNKMNSDENVVLLCT